MFWSMLWFFLHLSPTYPGRSWRPVVACIPGYSGSDSHWVHSHTHDHNCGSQTRSSRSLRGVKQRGRKQQRTAAKRAALHLCSFTVNMNLTWASTSAKPDTWITCESTCDFKQGGMLQKLELHFSNKRTFSQNENCARLSGAVHVLQHAARM